MPRKKRGKNEIRGEETRSNEEARKPPPYGGSSVGGAALSPGVSRDAMATDFQSQRVHGGLQKEGVQSDQRSVDGKSWKSCPEPTAYNRRGRTTQELTKEAITQQHKDEATVARTRKVTTFQTKKRESNDRGSCQTPTEEARLKEHDAGGSSRGQDKGASRQDECSSQEHNEPDTEGWKTVPSRKSNRHLKSYSARESSPHRTHRLLPDADNTLHHSRNPPHPHEKPKQGQKPTTQSEVATEDQQRISEIKELVKASEPVG